MSTTSTQHGGPSLPATWSASWITAAPDPDCPTAAPLFRREWPLAAPIESAVLHLAGLGNANATINGTPVDDTYLGPGQSDYGVVARAKSVDITALVTGHDALVLAVDLGRGFYDLHSPEVWRWSTAPWRDTPRLTAEVHLTFVDGTQAVLVSDEQWQTGFGGSRFDSLYEGETWDQTAEPAGWREPGFAAAGWSPAQVCGEHAMAGTTHRRYSAEVATTGLPLRQAIADPIRVFETLSAEWQQLPDGRWVGDVGKVIAGWVRVTPKSADPLTISIKQGELLEEDGSVRAENRFIPTGRFQTDHLTLVGEPWEARHTWKGFRYLEVTGADPTKEVVVEARRAAADVARTGQVTSTHPTLHWLDDAFRQTVLTNLHWVPTDTPTYEKNGWTGDCLVALPAMLTRFDLANYLASWLDDFLDAQEDSGVLPVIIPSAGWGIAEGECAPAPEWTTLYPTMVDALEREYGLDLWSIHREGVVSYLRYELGRLDEDGLSVGILGDYLSPGTGGPPPEDVRQHSTIAMIRALDLTAAALAGSPEAREFADASAALAQRHNEIFFDVEQGHYAAKALSGIRYPAEDDPGFRQAIQVQALDAGIVPPEHEAAVVANLVADIESRGDHHNLGCLGTARLYSMLIRHGHADLAIRVAANPTGPSWESWRTAGHSTLLEMWVDPVRSRAHYFQGAGVRFLEDDLIGLTATAPQWQQFRFAPLVLPEVGEVRLVRGDLQAGWQCHGTQWSVDLVVPEGSTATVVLPQADPTQPIEVGPGQYGWAGEL